MQETFTTKAENLLTGQKISHVENNYIILENGLLITFPSDTIQEINNVLG